MKKQVEFYERQQTYYASRQDWNQGYDPTNQNPRQETFDRRMVSNEIPVLEELKDCKVRDFIAAVKSCAHAVPAVCLETFLEVIVATRIRSQAKTRLGEVIPASVAQSVG